MLYLFFYALKQACADVLVGTDKPFTGYRRDSLIIKTASPRFNHYWNQCCTIPWVHNFIHGDFSPARCDKHVAIAVTPAANKSRIPAKQIYRMERGRVEQILTFCIQNRGLPDIGKRGD